MLSALDLVRRLESGELKPRAAIPSHTLSGTSPSWICRFCCSDIFSSHGQVLISYKWGFARARNASGLTA